MAMVTVSEKKGGRIYHRLFDHELAQEMRAQGMSYQSIADALGVSYAAVRRVCDPKARATMAAHTNAWLHENRRTPCKGGCGRLVWFQNRSRTGYCPTCLAAGLTKDDVRPTELRCTRCREWKPDADFPTDHPVRSRRGHSPRCRVCSAAVRREFRHRHPEIENAAHERQHRARRERREMAKYIVFQPNGDGYKEFGKVDANSPNHAIEKLATGPGRYVAVSEAKFRVVEVEPVQAFRVKT